MNTYPPLAESAETKTKSTDNNIRSNDSNYSYCKVLYVEDNVFTQELARKLFTKIGCELEIACDGYQALEMIIKEKFDLIFMDINMPGLNGYETTSIIRRKLRLKIPILALTNCDSDEDVKLSRSFGMNDHLKKPLNERQLTNSIIRWRKKSLVTKKFINV